MRVKTCCRHRFKEKNTYTHLESQLSRACQSILESVINTRTYAGCVDLFSQYTWQLPVRTVGSAEAAAAALDAFVQQVKRRFSWPDYPVVVQVDNGAEFQSV